MGLKNKCSVSNVAIWQFSNATMSIISNTTKKAIEELVFKFPQSEQELAKAKREIAKKYKVSVLQNSSIYSVYQELIKEGRVSADQNLEELLIKRQVRTLSGVAPVAVLTKPYPCPGECAYCPDEEDIPKSYLSNEPAVMRAIRNQYNPYTQVQLRLKALEENGHSPTKIELIVIGGSWSVLPEKYKYWYIKECFRAANQYSSSRVLGLDQDTIDASKKELNKASVKELREKLKQEQNKNEKKKYKMVGITLETRPDFINEKEVTQMREVGCTRVELGVQMVDDEILETNKRGHGVAEIARATQLLRDKGFKITYHIMPGLPGSDCQRDVNAFRRLFTDERFQPDQIKFYPTVVTQGSLLYTWWQQGKYQPYTDQQLKELIKECKQIIPPYVRIIRLIRDIPEESIVAGNRITNLRQLIKEEGVECRCIRCREAGKQRLQKEDIKLTVHRYQASGGEEYFLSYTSPDEKVLYGFCRLRIPPSKGKDVFSALQGAALIRELHVYGKLVPVGEQESKVQHTGLGRMLMEEAERVAEENGSTKIAVISGVGVRDYYRKMGYRLQDTYMVKKLDTGY